MRLLWPSSSSFAHCGFGRDARDARASSRRVLHALIMQEGAGGPTSGEILLQDCSSLEVVETVPNVKLVAFIPFPSRLVAFPPFYLDVTGERIQLSRHPSTFSRRGKCVAGQIASYIRVCIYLLTSSCIASHDSRLLAGNERASERAVRAKKAPPRYI